ncbi:MAG: hypothetical protein LKF00_04380 [Olsenella sp.]|jgi:hypothetical protein|nr:hypothetical protein [Olsenella sp.]MCI1289428.1 hypothetical protein [Olsenella sp.]
MAESQRSTTGTPEVPEGFNLALALVDAVPVALFGASALVAGERIGSPAWVVGASLALAGGTGKVAWKLVMALARKNVPILSRQMRYVMPAGFALMVAGAALDAAGALELLRALVRMPSLALVLAWLVCMLLMVRFVRSRNQLDVRSNWIEQGTNALGQLALLCALLLA